MEQNFERVKELKKGEAEAAEIENSFYSEEEIEISSWPSQEADVKFEWFNWLTISVGQNTRRTGNDRERTK